MPNRVLIFFLCAASLAFAGTNSVTHPRGKQTNTKQVVEKRGPVATSFSVDVRQNVGLTLDVANQTRRMLELQFPSGITHDFYIVDAAGREVWRWSEGRMFTQTLKARLVKARSSASFESEWRPGRRRGKFTAVAVLRSSNHPVEQRVDFAIN